MRNKSLLPSAKSPTKSTNGGVGSDIERAADYVLLGDPMPLVTEIGKLYLPKGSGEAIRCEEVRAIISEYAAREVARPLSISVFGPPGSGKSFCVSQIVESAGCGKPIVINMSQLASPRDLAESLEKGTTGDGDAASVASESPSAVAIEAIVPDAAKTKVFFFDEFDASLDGAPLGWLKLFLAPMQDGKLFWKGKTISIGKAVFMFAGGTAVSLAEFEKRALEDPEDYRNKKVPDFISRLHGFVDIEGINGTDDQRSIRRALVLRHFLKTRWPGVPAEPGPFPISRTDVSSLLSNVHFVHGVRSMQALLDMSSLDLHQPGSTVRLPNSDLRKLHLSRGLLDGKVIGISAGQGDVRAEALINGLSQQLLKNGATLAYGGEFVPDGTLSMVIKAAKSMPDELIKRTDKRVRNYLAFPCFYHEWGASKGVDQKDVDRYIESIQLQTLTDAELDTLAVPRRTWFRALDEEHPKNYNPNHHLAWAISLFRMRSRMIEDLDALIVVGGKNNGMSWGRLSGIAEEVMLASVLEKPIYVLGGLGGGAAAVGQLLGLDATIYDPERCLTDEMSELPLSPKLQQSYFRLPGHPNLPASVSQFRQFLFDRGVTTPAWKRNGLSPEENRELFARPVTVDEAENISRCIDLIVAGLLRLDWTIPARPALG